ncbi:hypothetical protein AAVH_35040, partial [Aphelenchoides avenae]
MNFCTPVFSTLAFLALFIATVDSQLDQDAYRYRYRYRFADRPEYRYRGGKAPPLPPTTSTLAWTAAGIQLDPAQCSPEEFQVLSACLQAYFASLHFPLIDGRLPSIEQFHEVLRERRIAYDTP